MHPSEAQQFSSMEWSYAAAAGGILNSVAPVAIKAAAPAGQRNYISSVQIVAEALGAATELVIRSVTSGNVLFRIKIGTGGLTNGLEVIFANPLKSVAAEALEVVTLTASVTGAVYFNAQGFTA